MIQRILVATDFSPTADEAWRWAIDLARRLDAELCLVYIAMPMSPDAPRNVVRDHERMAVRAEGMLKERAATAALATGVKTILRTGEPVQVLTDMARAGNTDLVVVGAQHHRAGDILVGSVAERLIRVAPCPVVVVKSSTSRLNATS